MSTTSTSANTAIAPTEEARTALAKLRNLLADVPPGPWGVNGPWWWDCGDHNADNVTTCVVTDDNEPIAILAPPYNRHPNAEYAGPWIAKMSPAFGTVLAGILENAVQRMTAEIHAEPHDGGYLYYHNACNDPVDQEFEGCLCFADALSIARHLNQGGAS